MTTYTFLSNVSALNRIADWGVPSRWVGGVVPNDPTADVVVPAGPTQVGVTSGFTLHSLQVAGDQVVLQTGGSLSIADTVTLLANGEFLLQGGSLTANSFTMGAGFIESSGGQVTVTGTFLNQGSVEAVGGLTITAGGFTNSGTLSASFGDLTVNVANGGFTNLSGGTLTGGTYITGSSSSTLHLNVGTAITALGGTIKLNNGGHVTSLGPLESTLTNITSSGTLSLENQTYATGNLSVDGTLKLADATTFSSSHLTVDAGGHVLGTGTITGPVDVAGAGGVVAGHLTNDIIFTNSGNSLTISGPVGGAGTLEVGAAVSIGGATLELAGAASANVAFADTRGTLKLDVPTSYAGAITLAGYGSTVNLAGISLQSVTSYGYSGNSSGGTLTLQRAGGPISLAFTGNFSTGSFNLSAGPQASLNITAASLGSDHPPTALASAQLVRLYDAALDRDADASGLTLWVGVRTNGAALDQIAQAFVVCPEFATKYGPTLTDSDFVEDLYWNAFGRAADAGGKAAALDALAHGESRADLMVSFSESQEHLIVGNVHQSAADTTNRLELMRLYDTALDRDADAAELTSWMGALSQGQSLNQGAQAFLDGPEFAIRFGPQLTDNDFVEDLYWNAFGRAADAGGKAASLDALAHGESRADLLVSFSESQEHLIVGNVHQSAADTTNRLELMRLYDTAVDRDADAGGLTSWMGALSQGKSLNQVGQAFLDGPEFATRYGPNLTDNDFVEDLYWNAFGRATDAGGKAVALDALAHGESRADLMVSFSESQEHLIVGNVHQSDADTTDRVELTRLYDTAVDRDADAGGLINWMAAMNQGESLDQVAQAFLDGPEFATRYGPTLTDSDFVDALYGNALNRAADAGGKAASLDALAHGETRANLMVSFSESLEHLIVGNVHQL